MYLPKVFCIGLPKTGTSSIAKALEILGYSVVRADLSMTQIEHADAATHEPVHERFAELDKRFPGSKFIWTVRKPDDWLRSLKSHQRWCELERRSGRVFQQDWLLATPPNEISDEEMLSLARDHAERVEDYFRGREGDILKIDVSGGAARWDGLCAFLDRPVPGKPFPFKNAGVRPFLHYSTRVARVLHYFMRVAHRLCHIASEGLGQRRAGVKH